MKRTMKKLKGRFDPDFILICHATCIGFGLVIVYLSGKQLFNHVRTEPLLPGYLPAHWRA